MSYCELRMSDTESFLRVRWIAPYPATWKTYIFYHGVAFDLAPYLDQPLPELMNAASSLWGVEIPAKSALYYRLYRAVSRLCILRDVKISFEKWQAFRQLAKTGVITA